MLGFSVTTEPLPPLVSELHDKLVSHATAIILCTREYADAVSKSPGMKDEIIAFGKSRNDALHTLLLYEGRFADGANKVTDRNFLARLCFPIVKVDVADPLIPLLRFIDVFTLLSGSQGLGILPDLMDLKVDTNHKSREVYQSIEDALQAAIRPITVDFRLRAALLKSHHNNSLVSLLHSEKVPNMRTLVDSLIGSSVRTGLVLCPTSVDTALVGLALEQQLIGHSWRCISIDCARYQGNASHHCVADELQKASIKSHSDYVSVQANPVVILFKGYDAIGTYDNLFVKNQLSSWPQVKVAVTCRMDTFQHRSHASSFLPDPTAPRMELLRTTEVPTFASKRVKEEFTASIQLHTAQPAASISSEVVRSTKSRSQHAELTNFLCKVSTTLVESGLLKKNLADNPRVFISYAWEQNKELVVQQQLLRQIVVDLQTLGFPTWLDVERMTGDIDQQMAGNIATSSFALIIGTPRYCERAEQDTNVRKEYLAILDKEKDLNRPLRTLPVIFGQNGQLPLALKDPLSLKDILQFGSYSNFLLELIPRILGTVPLFVQTCLNAMTTHLRQQLRLVPGKHLIIEHNQDMVQSHDIDNRLEGYLPTFGLASPDDTIDTRYNLTKSFERFVASPTKTFVVFGEAGSGKSLFALAIFKRVLQEWHTYRKNSDVPLPDWLPIYIPLKNHAQGVADFAAIALRAFDLDSDDVHALREGLGQNQKLLFILDGYDELGRGMLPNLPQMLVEWRNAKVIITSRPEHFDNKTQHLQSFALQGTALQERSSFETHYVSPFILEELEEYVIQYHTHRRSERGGQAHKALQEIPGLLALLSNPFLLNLTLQSLDLLKERFSRNQHKDITRTAIYQAFSKHWFGKEAFKRNVTESECMRFAQCLAFAFFTHNTIKVSVGDALWDEYFGERSVAAQNACPLRRSNQEFSFMHKSLFEFFAAFHLWDSLFLPDAAGTWSKRPIKEERAMIEFLAELHHVDNRPQSDYRLLQLVHGSRGSSPDAAIAAANAITVLNATGFCFSGMDLSYIRIPGAELSCAIMHETQLRGSDMQGVLLAQSCLNSTDLRACNLSGVDLGVYPKYQHPGPVMLIAFSSGGNHIATACLGTGLLTNIPFREDTIYVWQIDTHDCKTFASGHVVEFMAFSSHDSKLTYMTDWDIGIWDLTSGNHQVRKLSGSSTTCAAISADGRKVAYCQDSLLAVQDLVTGIFQELSGHTRSMDIDAATSVMFSLDGTKLATANVINIMVWNLVSGNCQIRDFQAGPLVSIAFSPDGGTLAYGDLRALKLWDLASESHRILHEHGSLVTSAAFSPDGNRIASGSLDGSVIVWDFKQRSQQLIQGHADQVSCVAFSPDSRLLASGSNDRSMTVRDLKLKLKTQTRLNSQVTNASFSPDGCWLATLGNKTRTVKLWNLQNGNQRTLRVPFEPNVEALGFSNDKLSLGCTDNIVVQWDLVSWKCLVSKGREHRAKIDGKPHSAALCEYTDVHSSDFQFTKKRHTATSDVLVFSDQVLTVGTSIQFLDVQILSLDFFKSSGGKLAYSTHKTVTVWDITVDYRRTLEGHSGAVTCIAFSQDGMLLASGSADKTVRVWDLERGSNYVLAQHSAVSCVAFSPTRQLVVCTEGDIPTIEVWANRQNLPALPARWLRVFTCVKSLDTTDCILDDCIGLNNSSRLLFEQRYAK